MIDESIKSFSSIKKSELKDNDISLVEIIENAAAEYYDKTKIILSEHKEELVCHVFVDCNRDYYIRKPTDDEHVYSLTGDMIKGNRNIKLVNSNFSVVISEMSEIYDCIGSEIISNKNQKDPVIILIHKMEDIPIKEDKLIKIKDNLSLVMAAIICIIAPIFVISGILNINLFGEYDGTIRLTVAIVIGIVGLILVN